MWIVGYASDGVLGYGRARLIDGEPWVDWYSRNGSASVHTLSGTQTCETREGAQYAYDHRVARATLVGR